MPAQTPDQPTTALSAGRESAAVDYAMTGTAAVEHAPTGATETVVAPLLVDGLAANVAQAWVASTADLIEVCAWIGAEPVESGTECGTAAGAR